MSLMLARNAAELSDMSTKRASRMQNWDQWRPPHENQDSNHRLAIRQHENNRARAWAQDPQRAIRPGDQGHFEVVDIMKVCLYARVSKALEQDPANQFEPLTSWLRSAGHEQVKDSSHPLGIFVDEISSKDTRPKKEEILKLLRLGVADGVAFVALDRWGRTASELVLELEEFSKTGKAIISLKEGLDLSSAAGRLMANVLAAMANFERDRIRERTLLGLARAKAQGKRLGRPRKTPPENPPPIPAQVVVS